MNWGDTLSRAPLYEVDLAPMRTEVDTERAQLRAVLDFPPSDQPDDVVEPAEEVAIDLRDGIEEPGAVPLREMVERLDARLDRLEKSVEALTKALLG